RDRTDVPFLSASDADTRELRLRLDSFNRRLAHRPSHRWKLGIDRFSEGRTLSQSAARTACQNDKSVPCTRPGRLFKTAVIEPSIDSASIHSQNSIMIAAASQRDRPVALAMARTSGFLARPFCQGIQSPAKFSFLIGLRY